MNPVRNFVSPLEIDISNGVKNKFSCSKFRFRQDWKRNFKHSCLLFIVLLLVTCAAGCVSRKITINSQPQGAKVFFDYKQVGETPCSFDFIHYGAHHLELVKDGFENLNATVKLKAPIYEYIPLDFFAENILPFHFKDEHTHSFSLTPGVSRSGYIIPEKKEEEEGEEEEE